MCNCVNQIPIAPTNASQKDVKIIAGPGIIVQDTSDLESFRFLVSATNVEALIATLTIIAKEAGVARANPVLKGTVIDRVELDWAYNKAVTIQSLSNTGGLTSPTLNAADRSYDYVGQVINSNINFTIQGNDGLGLGGSIDSDTQSILFGNEMILGEGVSKILTPTSGLEAFIDALATKVVKTSRSHTYFATGGAGQKHFVAYPKSFGLGTFEKLGFPGGYIRLKNVAGTLKANLDISDTETDILFTNPKGFQEAYYVYESLYDNQNDPVNPFTLS